MAPTFRSSRSGRQLIDNSAASRSRTVDHDVFEGLPVRRWTRQPHIFSQAEKMDEPDSGIGGAAGGQPLPELPMPKDSHLLTPSSRALLRAARAGCIYIRHVNKDTNGEQKETTDIDDTPAAVPRTERSFTAKKWTAVPRHMEPPEVEFLARRRPGLPSLYGASALNALGSTGITPAPPMRKTKFKKVDPATGNVSIYEAWIPEGHTLEGEIKETGEVVPEQPDATVIKETPAPGTVVEGVGIVNAEGVVVASAEADAAPKRRPPPPKRKAKGVGKGRKKKVMFAPGEGGDAGAVHAAGADGAAAKQEGLRMSIDGAAGEPIEGSDEEEEEGEEGEESDEDAGSAPATKSPSAAPQEAGATPATEANVPPTSESNTEAQNPASATANEDSTTTERPMQQEKQPSPQVPSDTRPADVDMKLSEPDSEKAATQPPVAEQPSTDETPAPAPPVAEPVAALQPVESEPMEGVSQEQPISAPQEPQETRPEPQPEEMAGVEHTQAGNTTAPAEPEKAEEAKPESTTEEATAPQEAEAPAPTESSVAVETNTESTGPKEPAPEPAPAPSNNAEVDLLGTLEASLGDKPSEQQEQPAQPAPSSSSPKPAPSEPAPEPSAPEPTQPEPAETAPAEAPVEPAPDAAEEKKETKEE
ncbi:hypothetical protein DTO166G4_5708 [Paecilomyces variotii]|nr:hypothetical protein DTO166G4_5708 [Paecilomyces variotii]KAJ9243073.1 hypothetical protein DTO166G5_177 [Paecilomyces variotii]